VSLDGRQALKCFDCWSKDSWVVSNVECRRFKVELSKAYKALLVGMDVLYLASLDTRQLHMESDQLVVPKVRTSKTMTGSKPPQPGDGFVDSPPVTIIVGKDLAEKTYYIHRERLIKHSEYFRTALNSNFSEGDSLTFRLEEDDPSAMWLFAMSQYKSLSDIFDVLYFDDDSTQEFSMNDCLSRHAHAFVLGNKLVASKFKKHLIRSLHSFMWRHSEQLIDMSSVLQAAKVVYNGTSTEDGWEMRVLLAVYCATRMGHAEQPTYATGESRDENAWAVDERKLLVSSGLEDFLVDVLAEVQHVKLPTNIDYLILTKRG